MASSGATLTSAVPVTEMSLGRGKKSCVRAGVKRERSENAERTVIEFKRIGEVSLAWIFART
jgi:hypothetical protein